MKQETALAIMKSGKNVFLTGSAGSGKTYCLNQYIDYLKEYKIPVAITASTGIAATHMGGMTIHSWSGIGIRDQLTALDLKSMSRKAHIRERLRNTEVLVIDEISMLHLRQLTLVDEVLQYFKKSSSPFGGMQVILCGDFFQLPPVSRERDPSSKLFCFMAPVWVDAEFKVCYLTEQYRSKDSKLNELLNAIRDDKITDETFSTLEDKIVHNPSQEFFPKLYPTNFNVDLVNSSKLEEISEKSMTYACKKEGNKAIADSILKSILAPELLELKLSAEVMFVKNNIEQGYFNGTRGKVVGFSKNDNPIVRLLNGREIVVEYESWTVEDEGGTPIASISQIPLRLAWAITIHKSQGMTLDEATIDLGDAFEFGQGYVALSRLASIDGLQLLGYNSISLKLDSFARKADVRFRELSKEAEASFDAERYEKLRVAFIEKTGLKPTTQQSLLNPSTRKKDERLKKVLDLAKKGYRLRKIAAACKLSEDTILKYLHELRHDKSIDFSQLIDQDDLLVEKMLPLVKEQGDVDSIKLKPIYEGLDREYSYDDIRRNLLCLYSELYQ